MRMRDGASHPIEERQKLEETWKRELKRHIQLERQKFRYARMVTTSADTADTPQIDSSVC